MRSSLSAHRAKADAHKRPDSFAILPKLRHPAEQHARIGRGVRISEFAVKRGDVDGNAFSIAPTGEIVERDGPRGFQRPHPGIVTFLRFIADIDEVVAHALDAMRIGHRAMTGHDYIGL